MGTYLAAKNSSTSIDGVPMAVEAGSVTLGTEVDEVTNNLSGGFYEDVDTVKKATADGMRLVYNGDAPPTFREGQLVTWSGLVTNGPTISGTFRIGSLTVSMHQVKEAVRYTFNATSQGEYTFDWGGSA